MYFQLTLNWLLYLCLSHTDVLLTDFVLTLPVSHWCLPSPYWPCDTVTLSSWAGRLTAFSDSDPSHFVLGLEGKKNMFSPWKPEAKSLWWRNEGKYFDSFLEHVGAGGRGAVSKCESWPPPSKEWLRQAQMKQRERWYTLPENSNKKGSQKQSQMRKDKKAEGAEQERRRRLARAPQGVRWYWYSWKVLFMFDFKFFDMNLCCGLCEKAIGW